jgi:hypothetical protein
LGYYTRPKSLFMRFFYIIYICYCVVLLVTLMIACNTILAVLNGVIQHGNDCSIL